MRYENPVSVGYEEFERIILFGDERAICSVLVGVAMNDEDGEWVQDKCLELTEHGSAKVRSIAALSLGHVARNHRKIDHGKVRPKLECLLNDPVAGPNACEALEDISFFAKKRSSW